MFCNTKDQNTEYQISNKNEIVLFKYCIFFILSKNGMFIQ